MNRRVNLPSLCIGLAKKQL